MTKQIINEAEEKMEKATSQLKRELATLRAGRATPALLDKVMVDYYGSPTPLNQLANISVPEARMLIIQPWDKSVLADIEKAIQKSELGLNPNNDGDIIRITIPMLTEERRLELVKMVKKYGEEAKVAVRNVRRDANEQIKKLEKDGTVSEDEARRYQEQIQKITDETSNNIDKIVSEKEKDIMEV